MIYWDTSAIVPLYAEEAASAFWESLLLESLESGLGARTSTLAVTEFNYALRLKVFHEQLDAEDARALIAKFTEDCDLGRWALCPLGTDVIGASLEVAASSYGEAAPIPLRSLDGLHLGAARVLKCQTVATGDERLAAVAARIGMAVRSPH